LCKSAIHPFALLKHCQKAHSQRHLTPSSNTNNESFGKEKLPALLEQSLLDPRIEPLPLPQTECEPFVHLRVEDGFGCNYCTLVSKTASVLRKHYNVKHAPLRRSRADRKALAPVQSVRHSSGSTLAGKRLGRPLDSNGSLVKGRVGKENIEAAEARVSSGRRSLRSSVSVPMAGI
jgi:hypothetical protein